MRRIGRRKFLGVLTAGAAGSALLDSCRRAPYEEKIMKVYTSGEKIQARRGVIEVDGWNLEVHVNSSQPKGDMPELSVIDAFEEVRKIWLASKTRVYPPEDGRIIIIEDCTGEAIRVYPVKLAYYTHHPSDKKDYIRVYSEVEIPNSELEQLHLLHRIFSCFGHIPPVYVFKSNLMEQSEGSTYYPDNILIPHLFFSGPAFDDQGRLGAYHEFSHGIVHRLRAQSDYRLGEIVNAYINLAKKAGVPFPIPVSKFLGIPPEIKTHPCYEIFDESSYVAKRTDPLNTINSYGNPSLNFNELFASALTVLRFFPERFIEKYHKLTSKQKEGIKQVCAAILAVLDSIYLENTENPHTNYTLTDLLPSHQEIRNRLGM